MKKGLLFLFIVLVAGKTAIAQISIAALPYNPGTTNFNTYNPSSAANLTSTIPTGWTATSGGTAVYNGQGDGTTLTAGYWAYGTGGDFSLGAMPSGASTPITYSVSFTNNSGSTITVLSISWDYEQWNYTSGGNNSWDCSATGVLAGNATINGQDYNVTGTGTNGTVTTSAISFTLTGLSIANGSTFGIQWVTANAGSAVADKGIGIDNFSIIASRTDNTDYFRTRQSGNWATTTTWQSSKDGSLWINSNLAPDNNANTITVVSGHTVTTVAASVSIDQATINSGGQISVSGGQTLTIGNGTGTDLTVDGTLYSAGTITTTGTIAVNATGTYQHAQNGGTIPTATWDAASTCYVTGLTNTAPAGLTQSFGNFTYDCPDHSTLINFNSALTSIAGDFYVRYAGEEQGSRTLNGLALSSNTSFTLTIGGDLIIDHPFNEATWLIMTTGTANVTMNIGGDFLMSNSGGNGSCFFDYKYGTGTAMGTLVINLTGNLTMTGGYLDMAYQASSYSVATELRLYGNLSVSASSTIISSGASLINGKIIFSKTGTQTMYEGGAGVTAYVNYQVNSGSTTELLSNFYLYDYITAIKSGNFTVLSGGIVDMNTYVLHGYNVASGQTNVVNTYTSFVLNSGAGIITANTNGVHRIGFTNGSVSAAIATRTFSSGANYTYDATAVQNSGTFVTTPVANQVNNLTINNTAGTNTTGVTLQQEIKVASTCTFVNGVFTTTNTNVLTIIDGAAISGADLGVGSNKYVNGPLKKIGNDAFTFPVGKQSHGCRPISISGTFLSATDEFRAELIRGDAGSLSSNYATGLEAVSGCEYWYLDRLVGSSNVNVTLSWSGESPCNAMSYVTDLPNLVVAHFNSSIPQWDLYGNDGGTTGDAVSGTVTWNNVSSYSPFSLGSLLWWSNPLAIKFINLKATERSGQVKLDWTNAEERNVQRYFVEHSADGLNFTELNSISARNNNGALTDYNWWHSTPVQGINYYRVKAVELSGEVTYSQVVRINIGKNINEFTIFPNPVTGNNIGISASNIPSGKYDIIVLNMTGQKILQSSVNHPGGAMSMRLNLPQSIKAGIYSIQFSGQDQKQIVKTFLVQ